MNDRVQSPLDSLTHLFLAEASEARLDNMHTTLDKIQASSFTSSKAAFTSKQRLFRSGLDAWLESLTALTDKYAQKLQDIAVFHPELVGTSPDPPRWVRSQLEQLLEKALGHELSAEALASPPRMPPTGKRSLYHIWFLNVCGDWPDFDTYPGSGWPDRWCAPAWCWTDLTFKWWVRRGRPKRLDFDLTEKLIRSVQRLFAMRLSHVLNDQIEHKVRVAMASSGKLAVMVNGLASSNATQVAAAGASPKLPSTAISGQIASHYDEELRKMQEASRGRHLSEARLRQQFPNFTIWSAIEDSQTLPPQAKREYFSRSLAGRTYQHRFDFIAKIMGAGDSSTVYRWYKQYRKSEALNRSRRRRSNSKPSEHSAPTT